MVSFADTGGQIKMIPIITGFLFGTGFVFCYFIYSIDSFKTEKKGTNNFIIQALQLYDYRDEKKKAKLLVNKEIILCICISVSITLFISFLTDNPLILIVGIITGVYLPNFIINKNRKMKKMVLINKLTDPLRMLLSRIPDQQNITRAMEVIKDETKDENIKQLFMDYLSEVSIGGSVRDALISMKRNVKLKKFDVFVEHLIQAQYEGFTSNAMKALEKTVEAIEFDLRAIEKVKEKSKIKKKQLYTTLATTWLFPMILSFVNTGQTNIYLNTIAGKILIFLYFLASIYVFERGEEYLSLKLDEL